MLHINNMHIEQKRCLKGEKKISENSVANWNNFFYNQLWSSLENGMEIYMCYDFVPWKAICSSVSWKLKTNYAAITMGLR